MLFVQVLFWFSVGAVTYTYFVYPWLLRFLTRHKQTHPFVYQQGDELPVLSLLMAMYNEAQVIEAKLNSLEASNYPKDKLHIYIGNDNSTDESARLAAAYQDRFPHFTLVNFGGRSGKPNIINQLAAQTRKELGEEQLFIITDANVLFDADLITQLVSHYKDPKIGMVGANVINKLPNQTTIAELEQLYISRENQMKYREGLLNGALMGPFGACFSMRAALYIPLPAHFIVDDFYLCMQVHNQGYACIYDLQARCFEDVPGNMWEEFRRKSRIGAGNFQNLSVFKNWLLKPFHPVGFAFISHKVLRWITPFLAICGLVSIAILAGHNSFYEAIFVYKFVIVGLFFLDLVLVLFNIHIKPLRLITYFYFMNFALILGFIYFIKGIKSNVWQPTERKIADNTLKNK